MSIADDRSTPDTYAVVNALKERRYCRLPVMPIKFFSEKIFAGHVCLYVYIKKLRYGLLLQSMYLLVFSLFFFHYDAVR